ncbi:hypothetical protein CF70_032560 [Cupriavidus sp. SK-3]|uniref:acyl carrier protein n=1 Tax=Cupriavidus sp. SK-3 TaxID=1470558 RepID=UPI000445A71B|nr:acyl carrier protein [Cupriavidus sp. SK-3]KDP88103.1 hypothetical protein CF70_032560 [Cupriavidus sp. SK-3]
MPVSRSREEISAWCTQFIVNNLGIPPAKVDTSHEFDAYGLDSTAAVGLVVELEEWLGRPVDPSVLFEYPTIDALANHLEGEPA